MLVSVKQAFGGLARFAAPWLRARWLGLGMEAYFWRRWLKTRGLRWPQEYERRLDPTRALDAALQPYVAALSSASLRLLDVGAGPITSIGYQYPGKQLDVTAVDVLAPKYEQLLARYRVTPPVRTVYAEAEHLTRTLAANSFDIVHARNSLDHMRDPFAAVQEMVKTAKPGGVVLLIHKVDEGAQQHYLGLHQWNICERSGNCVLWNPAQEINVTERLLASCDTRTTSANGSVYVEIRKRQGSGLEEG